ncbi:hypothetical protein NIES4071_94740 [Calothrix sp. NIES-4071]|nr:hypothetical protein NIES4071_94740 [Calothrix sp. NIES-4071]BAZ63739.1 hypothetical protein NIES4105_94670 [Calothrix sp. NIES-4105]
MKIEELKIQLLQLNPSEKAEAIQTLTNSLSSGSRLITKTPGVCGGDACLANTRLPVWLFVSLRRQATSDAEILEFYPHLTAADLVNVWAYAEAYPDEIEIALQEQDEAMEEM